MNIEKDSDVFIGNGYLIASILDIQEVLLDISEWLTDKGKDDVNNSVLIEDALQNAGLLYRRLVDLQINLLTVLS